MVRRLMKSGYGRARQSSRSRGGRSHEQIGLGKRAESIFMTQHDEKIMMFSFVNHTSVSEMLIDTTRIAYKKKAECDTVQKVEVTKRRCIKSNEWG